MSQVDPFILWTRTRLAVGCRRPKNFGNARIPIDRKGRLSLVDEGDWKTCAPLGSSGRRAFCGQRLRPASCAKKNIRLSAEAADQFRLRERQLHARHDIRER